MVLKKKTTEIKIASDLSFLSKTNLHNFKPMWNLIIFFYQEKKLMLFPLILFVIFKKI